MGRRNDSRERTVHAAAELIAVRGVAGAGLREIVDAAGTPRGSLSHHFPGGKDELVVAAVERTADLFARGLEEAAGSQPPAGLDDVVALFTRWWHRTVTTSHFAAGCPVVAAALDADSEAVRRAAHEGFRRWIAPLTRIAAADGVPAPRDRQVATTIVAALEGAVVMARASGSSRPLHDVEQALGVLIAACRTAADPPPAAARPR